MGLRLVYNIIKIMRTIRRRWDRALSAMGKCRTVRLFYEWNKSGLTWLWCYLYVFRCTIVNSHLTVLFPRPLYSEFSLEEGGSGLGVVKAN